MAYRGGDWEWGAGGAGVGGGGGVVKPETPQSVLGPAAAGGGGGAGGGVEPGERVGPGGRQVEHDVLVDLASVEPCLDRFGRPQAELGVPQRAVGLGVAGIFQGGEVAEDVQQVPAVAQRVDQRGVAGGGVL